VEISQRTDWTAKKKKKKKKKKGKKGKGMRREPRNFQPVISSSDSDSN